MSSQIVGRLIPSSQPIVTNDGIAGTGTIRQVQAVDKVADAPRRPQHILALSGGGMFGAYTAGVLNGWSKSEQRPEFDVVTGISTGALIATLAFLGPEYDGIMERVYTQVTRQDIYTYRSWATVPFRDAVASSAPLKAIVECALTDEMMVAIAQAHGKGRRLYVGTTNLDTKRFVIWDIGAIATQGGPKAKALITNILIASCSIPGVFPPVPIDVELNGRKYTELHCDGGVTAPVFVPTEVMTAAAMRRNENLPKCHVYIIQSLKSYAEPQPVESRVLNVLGASAAAIFASQIRREVANIYHQCQIGGIDFHMAALPADFNTPSTGLEFDKKEMNKLFERGFEVGVNGKAWWITPPERGPGDTDRIRTGNQFIVK